MRAGLASSAAAILALAWLAPVPAAQFATVQREQKIATGLGGFRGAIGNDYRFGVSVAEVGDFDGDGLHDLVVGSHRANVGGVERGAVWLLYLNADGTVREERQISALAGGLAGPLDDFDRFGVSVCSLGDLDLDGTTDIAVGAYRDDDGGQDCGAVYLLFLAPDGTVKAERKLSALSGGFAGALAAGDSFGWSLESIGDLDDDGVVDLAVGASRDDGLDPDPLANFGALYVLFLNPDGTVKGHAQVGESLGGLPAVLRPSDRFGSDVVLLGDADGDGVEDLAVGAFGEDPLKYGKVFVLHMKTDGTVKSLVEIGSDTGGFTGVLGKGDRFGSSLASDDLDGDGIQDLLIGAVGDDDGGAAAGAIWACLLDASGTVRSVEKISPDFGGFGGMLYPGDNFGIACAVLGDLDRDGAADLAVGAYQDDAGGFDRGAVWVLFRAGTGVPVADFVSQPGTGDAPLAVTFTDHSSGALTALTWDFGDGTGASEASPEHVFEVPGVYDVTLTASGPLGADALTRQRVVVVKDPRPPQADFAVTPAAGPVPLATVFDDLSIGTITAWAWDFGDGTTSTQRQGRHVYEQMGLYSASLTVTGPRGTSTRSVPDLVAVLESLPVPDFTAEPTLGRPPLAVAFTDLSTANATSFEWDFGDGTTSTERNPTHVYELSGNHDVTLRVRGVSGGQELTRADCVRVTVPLAPGFDVVSSGGVAPVAVRFLDRSTGTVTSWSWDFGDGGSSTLRSPIHTYALGGWFQVQLTIAGPAETQSVTLPLLVPERPPVADFAATNRTGKLPLTVSFRDLSTGNITAWEWDFGDGTGSSAPNPKHTYRRAGLYTVRMRVHSAAGFNGKVRRDLITVTSPFPTRTGWPGTVVPFLLFGRRQL